MKRPCCLVVIVLAITQTVASAATALKRVPGANADTVAVVVPAAASLEHIAQAFDRDPANLLKELNLPPDRVVKINVFAATPYAADTAREAIRNHFPAESRPAVSIVVGMMPRPDVSVAMDAVVVAARSDVPPHPRVFISGQAELIAKTPGEATAKTLAKLQETLKFVSCRPADVVQVRYFLTPISAAAQVIGEFERSMPELIARSAMVEWESETPIEIEMVALAPQPASPDAPAIEYLTPPGMTASPLFARVVRVNRGDLIYIGDLYAEADGDGTAQVNSIFAQLQDVLKQTGSDMRHLVKATYFVSDEDASKELNAIRPKFYDPKRPPAASKAMVPVIGKRDRAVSLDMIAIPSTQPAP